MKKWTNRMDFLRILNYAGIFLASLYFISMVVFPLVQSKGDWGHVQRVWSSWQGLNIGILAFLSSVIAFNISRDKANKQREREFTAARAFLPESLSELCKYFKASAEFLDKVRKSSRDKPFQEEVPGLSKEYKEVFGNCIRYAEPDVGDYLSKILMRLQVHDSRLRSLVKEIEDTGTIRQGTHNLIGNIYGLGELQVLVNKLFSFARGMEEFDSSDLEWEDFRNAYSINDIKLKDYYWNEVTNLSAFTKRAIERDKN